MLGTIGPNTLSTAGEAMPQAPEIFKRSLDDIQLDGLPPRDAPGFEDAVLQPITLQYATKGYTAAIVV